MTAYLVWFILQVIADWKILSKAGRPGFLSFIPILNIVTEYDICWTSGMGLVYMACMLVSSILRHSGNGDAFPATISMVSSALSAAAFVIHVVQSFKLAKSFGKGTGMGILLIVFGPLARIILGVGDSQYIGKP